MPDRGSTKYFFVFCEGIAGSYPVRYPTGNKLYFLCLNWRNPRENKDKMKAMAYNNSYNNRQGAMARSMRLDKLIFYDDDSHATTDTLSYNQKITMLDAWCGADAPPIYLIITPANDNPTFEQPNTNKVVNAALSRLGPNTPLDYMKGTPKRLNPGPVGGHYEVDIIFKETTLF